MWPRTELLDLLGIDLPIIQAPMAGAGGVDLAVAVVRAGGLGSLPCAMLDAQTIALQLAEVREAVNAANVTNATNSPNAPINLNFFCHANPAADALAQQVWTDSLSEYYREFGTQAPVPDASIGRQPFDEQWCQQVEAVKPAVVSFHFGLPEQALLRRVKASGAAVISSATTVEEARWLEGEGCDAIIAQGAEAGGHRGMFLTKDVHAQPSLMALLPQVVDAVALPVIAAGGIADGRAIAAAFALGACGVQVGTAYLLTPQSMISSLHRKALVASRDDSTALTNVFSGRPARSVQNRLMREQGPLSAQTPAFPTAGAALAPLKALSEQAGSADFSSLWSGQAAALARQMDAGSLTQLLAQEALACLQGLGGRSGE
ncbi:MAG: nitronate monooxygenase [Bacteroidia bacterium]|jgi:nitronate monooxygenase